MADVSSGLGKIGNKIGLVENKVDDKVDSSRVLTDVPLNAVFTDTVLTEQQIEDMGFIAESKNNMQFALNITGV